MKITCQSCQSKYTVSDEKVQGKTVKIKCRKCGATILVNSSGVTTSGGEGAAAADEAAPTTAAGSYLVNVAEGDQRTMTLQELIDAYNSSVVTGETYVWSDGMTDWQPLAQVETITSALQPSNAGAPEPAAAPRAAARRDPGKKSADLFGGGREAQAAADDVGTGSPLFKSSSSAAPKPKPGEENSMLFSLSALTAKAAPAGGGAAAKALNNEDSGIIDLKALTAAAESRSKAKEAAPMSGMSGLGGMMPDDGGLFLAPPVLTAPVTGPAVAAPIEAPPKNRTPLFIGVGGAVAVLAIVGAFMVMKGGPEPQPTPAPETTQVAAAAPTPTPAPAPTPTPTAEASAAPSSTAVAPGTKVASNTKPGGVAKPGGTTAKTPAGPGGPSTGATPPPPPPPGPKKGNCGCAPGDLMCAMKCSAK